MTWCNDRSDVQTVERIIPSPPAPESPVASLPVSCHKTCPSCGHNFKFHEQVLVYLSTYIKFLLLDDVGYVNIICNVGGDP